MLIQEISAETYSQTACSTGCVSHHINKPQLLPQVVSGWCVSHEAVWAQRWVPVEGLNELITPCRAQLKTPASPRPSQRLMAWWLNSDTLSSVKIKDRARNCCKSLPVYSFISPQSSISSGSKGPVKNKKGISN